MTDAQTLIRAHAQRRANLMESLDELKADLKELDLEGKAKGLNVSEINKWVDAQRKGKTEKRRDTVADAVLIGEVLGIEFGFDDRHSGTVQNNAAATGKFGTVQVSEAVL